MPLTIVIASSYANDALLIQRQMKQLGVNVNAFIGTGGIYGLASFAEGLGNAVNGIFDTEGSASINDQRSVQERRSCLPIQEALPSQPQQGAILCRHARLRRHLAVARSRLEAGRSLEPEKIRPAALALDMPEGGRPSAGA